MRALLYSLFPDFRQRWFWKVRPFVLRVRATCRRSLWCVGGILRIEASRCTGRKPCPSATFVCFWRDSLQWAGASLLTRFLDHTQPRITVGRTSLEEWSARRRDLYLTTHSTHNRQTSMSPVAIRTHNLSRRAAADLRLRPRGHWDRPSATLFTTNLTWAHLGSNPGRRHESSVWSTFKDSARTAQ